MIGTIMTEKLKLILIFLYFFLFRRFQRPPGAISSSYLGLEAMTGALEDFGFEDYLNGKKN